MKVDFSSDFVTSVKRANDIIEIAQQYFSLERAGDLYRARCKHPGGDRTPSLTFFPTTQSFYCFACHAGDRSRTDGSDVISFVQWVENISWQEAIVLLAKRKGIPIPTDAMSEEEKQLQRLYDAALVQNRNYWSNLQENQTIKDWFEARGITSDEIDKWRLGCDNGVPVYPILDEYSRTVGFSRRCDNGHSKYVNDPTSPIFKKGNILYGLNFIKKEIRDAKYMVLVEGYNDAILLQRYGVPAVALMGTSLTLGHIALIKKYTNNVVLFLDGDAPGMETTLLHIATLQEEDINVEVVNILGFDPDDIAQRYKEDTRKFIESSKQIAFQFITSHILNRYYSDLIRIRKEAIRKFEEVVGNTKNEIEKRTYLEQLNNALFSTKISDQGAAEDEARGNIEASKHDAPGEERAE